MKDTTLTTSVQIDSRSIKTESKSEAIQITGIIVGGAILIVLILAIFTSFFDRN